MVNYIEVHVHCKLVISIPTIHEEIGTVRLLISVWTDCRLQPAVCTLSLVHSLQSTVFSPLSSVLKISIQVNSYFFFHFTNFNKQGHKQGGCDGCIHTPRPTPLWATEVCLNAECRKCGLQQHDFSKFPVGEYTSTPWTLPPLAARTQPSKTLPTALMKKTIKLHLIITCKQLLNKS